MAITGASDLALGSLSDSGIPQTTYAFNVDVLYRLLRMCQLFTLCFRTAVLCLVYAVSVYLYLGKEETDGRVFVGRIFAACADDQLHRKTTLFFNHNTYTQPQPVYFAASLVSGVNIHSVAGEIQRPRLPPTENEHLIAGRPVCTRSNPEGEAEPLRCARAISNSSNLRLIFSFPSIRIE